MSSIQISANSVVSAPVDRVYRIISDYETHHPNILPPAFSDLKVETGGKGAGTVLSFTLRLGTRSTAVRQRVSEPQPGRVVTETDLANGSKTTWMLVPEAENQTRVTIMTSIPRSKGATGVMEQLFAPRMFKKLYLDELCRLDRYAQSLESERPYRANGQRGVDRGD